MLSFTHDLNREAVRASQPSSAVHALDRQVASALLAAGALPVEVATQLASSAAPGDEVAIATLMRACDALGSTDPGQAADLARRALDLTTEHHPLRGPLVARAAILLNAAARSEEAQAFADSALRQALPALQEAQVRLSIASMFSISPEVRAESCRRALDLAGVPPDLRARLLALLFHNLVVAGRPEQAQQLLKEVKQAVEQTRDGAARFTLELAESALQYTRGHFETALALADAALRSGADVGEDPRQWLASAFRCGILAVMDRFDEALAAATEGIRSAQQGRQGRALQLFEASRARQLLQLGNLADAAAALEGRFSPDDAHLVLSVLDADGVVVLGRIALHTADQRQTELTSAIARVMLRSGVPGVERHAAWLLALQAQAAGDPAQARRWLTAQGETERLSLFPLFPSIRLTTRNWSASRWPAGTGSWPSRRRPTPSGEPRSTPGYLPSWPAPSTPVACSPGTPAGWPRPSASWKTASGGSRWPPPWRIWPWPRSGLAAATRLSPPSTAPW